MKKEKYIPELFLSKLIFSDTRFSFLWFLLRVYMGYEWLIAGWGKITSPVWTGAKTGVALQGFLNGALEKTGGAHPDVSAWYADIIRNFVLPNKDIFSYMVSYGEFLVGVALILGAFTGIAAFFGAFMNINYLFAGTVSINPLMFLAQVFLILAWRTAGWIGLDRFLLPYVARYLEKSKKD